MRRWVVLGVAIGGLVAHSLWALQNQETTLRFQFLPKETLTYEDAVRGEGTMTVNAGNREFNGQMQMDGTVTETHQVERVDDYGIATILTTAHGKVTFQMTTPNGEEERRTEEIPPLRHRMRVEPSGRILQVQWLDYPRAGKGKAPSPLGGFSLRFNQLPDWGFENLLLPTKPICVGDSWDIAQSLEMTLKDRPIKLEIKGQGRFAGWDKEGNRSCALLEASMEAPNLSDLFQQLLTALPPTGASNTAMDGSINSNAKYWFDPDAGRLLRVEERSVISLTFTVTLPTGQSISSQTLMTITSQKRLTKVGTATAPGKS